MFPYIGWPRDQLMWVVDASLLRFLASRETNTLMRHGEILNHFIMSKWKRGHTHKESQRLSKSWSFLGNTNTKSLTTFSFLWVHPQVLIHIDLWISHGCLAGWLRRREVLQAFLVVQCCFQSSNHWWARLERSWLRPGREFSAAKRHEQKTNEDPGFRRIKDFHIYIYMYYVYIHMYIYYVCIMYIYNDNNIIILYI